MSRTTATECAFKSKQNQFQNPILAAHRVLKLKWKKDTRRKKKKRAFAINVRLSWKWSVRRSEESTIYSWTHSLSMPLNDDGDDETCEWRRKKPHSTSILQLDWANGQNQWTVSDMSCWPFHARPSPSAWQHRRRQHWKLSQKNSERYGNYSIRTAAEFKTICLQITPHCSSHGRRCPHTEAHCYFITWK